VHLDAIHQWICDRARWIYVFTVVSAIGAEELSYLGRYSWLPRYLRTGTDIYAPAILPFNIGAILCVYLLGVYLVAPQRSIRTRAAVRSGSDNSYGVYLSQMIWIPFLLRLRNASGIHWPWQIEAPLALVLVYFMGYFFTAAPRGVHCCQHARKRWPHLRETEATGQWTSIWSEVNVARGTSQHDESSKRAR
jgi:hypothetical protein